MFGIAAYLQDLVLVQDHQDATGVIAVPGTGGFKGCAFCLGLLASSTHVASPHIIASRGIGIVKLLFLMAKHDGGA